MPTSKTLRGIAVFLLLISVTLTILRMTGVTTRDLGSGRLVVLIISLTLLLVAQRRDAKR
mgnify:CR=1 FL=1